MVSAVVDGLCADVRLGDTTRSQRSFSIVATATQVPITFVDRFFGESKLGANEVFSYLKGIWILLNSV